jgi:hypothetical protein
LVRLAAAAIRISRVRFRVARRIGLFFRVELVVFFCSRGVIRFGLSVREVSRMNASERASIKVAHRLTSGAAPERSVLSRGRRSLLECHSEMAERLPVEREEAFWAGVENARRFFMGEADVQKVFERLARALDEKGIPYAIIGALALNE